MATLQDLKRGLIDAHRMGDTVRARQLAMSIRLMEAPAMDAVPVAGQFGVQSRRRPLTMGERATEFSAGAGKAYGQAVRDITQQAERFGERYMEAVQDPRTGRIPFAPLAMAGYGAVQDIAAGIEPIVRNPAILGEMATGMAQQAVSGPQGAGEVFGSLVSPTQLGKAFQGPVMHELTKPGRDLYKKFRSATYGDGRDIVEIVDLDADSAREFLAKSAADEKQRAKIMALSDEDIAEMQGIGRQWADQGKTIRVFSSSGEKSSYPIPANTYLNLSRIRRAIEERYGASPAASSMSDSTYFNIGGKKIRVSDHALPQKFKEMHGAADIEINATIDSVEDALAKIANATLQ